MKMEKAKRETFVYDSWEKLKLCGDLRLGDV